MTHAAGFLSFLCTGFFLNTILQFCYILPAHACGCFATLVLVHWFIAVPAGSRTFFHLWFFGSFCGCHTTCLFPCRFTLHLHGSLPLSRCCVLRCGSCPRHLRSLSPHSLGSPLHTRHAVARFSLPPHCLDSLPATVSLHTSTVLLPWITVPLPALPLLHGSTHAVHPCHTALSAFHLRHLRLGCTTFFHASLHTCSVSHVLPRHAVRSSPLCLVLQLVVLLHVHRYLFTAPAVLVAPVRSFVLRLHGHRTTTRSLSHCLPRSHRSLGSLRFILLYTPRVRFSPWFTATVTFTAFYVSFSAFSACCVLRTAMLPLLFFWFWFARTARSVRSTSSRGSP